MKFQVNDTFGNDEQRKNFAQFLANTINADGRPFEPYLLNPSDNMEYVVDRGNNWFLTFNSKNASEFKLTYRYQCETVKAEEALAEWLKFRIKATVL